MVVVSAESVPVKSEPDVVAVRRRGQYMQEAVPAGEGAMAAILGLGGYVPEQKVSNAELSRHLETSDEWIRQRTGIAERRVAFHHVGRHVRFALSDLDEWLAAGRVEPITVATVCRDLREVA